MQYVQNVFLICLLLVISACSTTATGPATGREYKVQAGGWQDMDEYNRLREKAVENKDRTDEDVIDCNVVDCPRMILNDGTR